MISITEIELESIKLWPLQQKLDETYKVEECERKQESNQLLDALKCSLSTLLF